MNEQPPPKPEIPPEPGTARAVRQGRMTGRVFLVLVASLILVVILMVVGWFIA